jgi:putative modified peptide
MTSTTFDSVIADLQERPAVDFKPALASNKFPAAVAERLLDKLSSDDDFRALFLSDAREAMRSIGFETAAEHVGVPGADPIVCCENLRQLAPKGELATSRARLIGRLSTAPFHYAIDL